MPSPSRRRSGAAAVLGLLLLTACADPGDPQVGVKPLPADIVFGVTPPDSPTVVPNTAGSAGNADDATFFPTQSEDQVFTGRKTPFVARVGSPPTCRSATVNDFAPEVAPSEVGDSRPTPGVYLWKRSGKEKLDTPGIEQNLERDLTGFEDRLVKNITEQSATWFEYETVQKQLNGDVSTLRWRVRSDARQANPNSNFPPFRENVGEPDRGLSLVRITTETGDGTVSFDPRTPLLYLPLPATVGSRWRSVAVDPRTLNSLELDAGITTHAEVDACGDVVDGFKVEAILTSTNGGERVESKFNYIVATQFGALVVGEHIETPSEAPELVVDFNLGRVAPRPLPEGA